MTNQVQNIGFRLQDLYIPTPFPMAIAQGNALRAIMDKGILAEAREVMSNLKWSEARDGICWQLRYEASKKILGLLNGHGDKGLKAVAFRAMNYARKAAV